MEGAPPGLTFDWHSIRPSTLKRMPLSETLVIVATVVVVITHNLAIGVIAGVLVAMVLPTTRLLPQPDGYFGSHSATLVVLRLLSWHE